jgi:hypothetical protein
MARIVDCVEGRCAGVQGLACHSPGQSQHAGEEEQLLAGQLETWTGGDPEVSQSREANLTLSTRRVLSQRRVDSMDHTSNLRHAYG